MQGSVLFFSLPRTRVSAVPWSRILRQLSTFKVAIHHVPQLAPSGYRPCVTVPTSVCCTGSSCKGSRFLSTGHNQWKSSSSQQRSANRNTLMYVVAIAIAVTGLSYAAVPLYRIFCQATGYGGTVIKVDAGQKIQEMKAIEERELTIR